MAGRIRSARRSAPASVPIAATIEPLTAARLAELAIQSARLERTGRDGITYLIDTKRNGITTPLSGAYEREILRRTQARDLDEALRKII